MTTPVYAFFNNKGGVGKTTLVYHLAWMYSELGLNVVAADLDPQANLTAAFLDEDRLEELWPENGHDQTVFGSINPLRRGVGDIADPHLEPAGDRLSLLVGDLALSGFEDQLAEVWPKCSDGDERAFRVTSAFWRMMQKGAQAADADMILMDLGPNLGAINRAALIAADHVVVPLTADLFSLQGLRNLGPTLRRWRAEWDDRKVKNPASDLPLPAGAMKPVGYILLQHSERLDRPARAYGRWTARIPGVYRKAVLDRSSTRDIAATEDPNCLALLKHYRSLMPMAQDARKPMFFLKPADGAIGAHLAGVGRAYDDFKKLATKIASQTGISLP